MRESGCAEKGRLDVVPAPVREIGNIRRGGGGASQQGIHPFVACVIDIVRLYARHLSLFTFLWKLLLDGFLAI
jgi:hypothetical protein